MSRRVSLQNSHSGSNNIQANDLDLSASAVLEIQTRGIPLPGMVGPRSIHNSPVHIANSVHGFVNPLGPTGASPPMSVAGVPHHSPTLHPGID